MQINGGANTIGIGSVGVEVELSIGNLSKYLKFLNSTHGEGNVPIQRFGTFDGIGVCIDREYYDCQVEFKTTPGQNSIEYFSSLQKFFRNRFKESYDFGRNLFGGSVNSTDDAPKFVGTHLHLFLEKDGKPFTKMVGVKYQLLNFIYKELYKFFTKQMELGIISKNILFRELHRITTNHNILRYFDQEYMGNKLRSNMKNYGLDYRLFADGTDKKKYQPVLWSLANQSGKPFSLELRIIPNLFFFLSTPEEIVEFLKSIEKIINSTPKASEKEEVNGGCIGEILSTHNKLLGLLLKNMGGDRNGVDIISEEERMVMNQVNRERLSGRVVNSVILDEAIYRIPASYDGVRATDDIIQTYNNLQAQVYQGVTYIGDVNFNNITRGISSNFVGTTATTQPLTQIPSTIQGEDTPCQCDECRRDRGEYVQEETQTDTCPF